MKSLGDQDKPPVVGIVMGSDSDWGSMEKAVSILEQLNIPFDMTVSSAHRSPERTAEYARSARTRGLRVIIAGAGAAAHLAGFVAALTTLPVIGVPLDSSSLRGLDALLATAQMPAGVPVATMAIGAAGAKNAAILAAQILATSDPVIEGRLNQLKEGMAAEVAQKAESLRMNM
ncbi:MAG: 5-(carboxyamino)imidazole ribonucleotide mutase [Desulfobacterales bacterium C00003060]|nr:MAG: 5-(carboxyamino)imidazole ribonucleotide mutase [Desulfobacterales bacterium S3730MH5]OEU79857.1 MAG: 5-(carboxyamino)imidazole ribonucleotide mutase [Desulfobacterales bacterium S5133MH4]OEU80588.1 MAG: 5-(carboxyamino)imidazole ribonucleotide mutase [Desulfobacterales bacterium C00003060]